MRTIERDDEGVAHIVALSGGKDSTALALRLAEIDSNFPYTFVCTPTGDELPDLLRHWAWLEEVLGRPVLRLYAEHDLNGLIAKWGALPNYRQRWCTRMLKIEPIKRFYREVYPCKAYVGLRADEPERGGLFGTDVEQVYPLREWGWGLDEVWSYCRARGARIPRRTDCARCYHQRLSEWWELWKQHLEIYLDAERQEIETGYTFRSDYRDSWPADLKSLRELFERGHIPSGVALQEQMFEEDFGPKCRVCSL